MATLFVSYVCRVKLPDTVLAAIAARISDGDTPVQKIDLDGLDVPPGQVAVADSATGARLAPLLVSAWHRDGFVDTLSRDKAAGLPAVGQKALVYTYQKYMSDADVIGPSGDSNEARRSGASHVLVAVVPEDDIRSSHRLAMMAANGQLDSWSKEDIIKALRDAGLVGDLRVLIT